MNLSKTHLYSKKIKSQSAFESGDSAFEVLAEHILEIGDVNAAMRNLVQEGFTGQDDRPVGGLKDIANRSQEERRFLLEKYTYDKVPLGDLLKELEKYSFVGSESLTIEKGNEVLSMLKRLDKLD